MFVARYTQDAFVLQPKFWSFPIWSDLGAVSSRLFATSCHLRYTDPYQCVVSKAPQSPKKRAENVQALKTMDYLIRFVQMHESFRKPETDALAELAGIELQWVFYSEHVG